MVDHKAKVNCLVVGNGAVGTAIASRLQILRFRCKFVGRKGPVYIKSRFEGWGSVTYLNIKPLSEEDLSKVDIAFITVKAYDLSGALERYLSYLPKNIPIISLCNGATEHIVAAVAKKQPDYLWRMGICTFGVSQISQDIFALKSTDGKVTWGPVRFTDHQKKICMEMSDVEKLILDSDKSRFLRWEGDILPLVRKKWLFNVVINSLTASGNLERNGLLLNDMAQLKGTFEEAHRLGLELWGSWNQMYDKLFEEMVCLISSTANNENSMARDLRLNRKTENDYLAGLSVGRRGYEGLNELAAQIKTMAGSAQNRRS